MGRVSTGKNENGLGTGGGNGHTTKYLCYRTQNLHMVKMINLLLYVFYHNKKVIQANYNI